jgi:hypothetical protein
MRRLPNSRRGRTEATRCHPDFRAFIKKLKGKIESNPTPSDQSNTPTNEIKMSKHIRVSGADTAFYMCECGYEKHIICGENARHGLVTVQRLHKKICKLAKLATSVRAETKTIRINPEIVKPRFNSNEMKKENMEFIAKTKALLTQQNKPE